MPLSLLKKFQTYQTCDRKIHQLEDKINNYEKRRKFLCIGISSEPKLLEFDNYYMGLKRKLNKAQKRKKNAIDSLAKKLGEFNQPLGEYESLLADLLALLTENNIDIKNQFYDLLLAYKQIEAEYQTKCRDNSTLSREIRERERERGISTTIEQ